MQNAPSHGQQGVVRGQAVAHAVAGLDEEGGDGQADQRARRGGELHVAAHAAPRREDVQRDAQAGEVGVQLAHALRAWGREGKTTPRGRTSRHTDVDFNHTSCVVALPAPLDE